MTATSSVASVWALSGIAITMLAVVVYLLMLFTLLFLIFAGLVYFSRVIRRYLNPRLYD